jgi:glycosyltransferase involved in cell wall biosynthesis
VDSLSKKIVLLSSVDIYGAAEAIYKLGSLFKEQGHQVIIIVKKKTKKDDFIVQYEQYFENTYKKKSILSRLYLKIKKRIRGKNSIDQPQVIYDPNYCYFSKEETSANVSAEQIIKQVGFIPDFIFAGMTSDFMNSTDVLNLQKITQAQVYNIAVDMNHFTGGCHYAWDCRGYIDGCTIDCPAIRSEFGKSLAKINFDTKFKNAKEGNFKIIAGSGWTLKQAKESKIYEKQAFIPNINSLIDTKLFNAKNKEIAKRIFDFDSSKFYILAGCANANEPRKGFPYLTEALKILELQLTVEQKNRIVLLVVSQDTPQEFKLLNFEKQKLEYITDYRLLVLLYQAVDLFVNTSIEDGGPMMVSEALACGTPVVGFDMGVVNNIVVNNYNGYKAKLKDSRDLAKGIKEILNLSKEEYKVFSENSVKQIKDFSSFEYAYQIFKNILHEKNSNSAI